MRTRFNDITDKKSIINSALFIFLNKTCLEVYLELVQMVLM